MRHFNKLDPLEQDAATDALAMLKSKYDIGEQEYAAHLEIFSQVLLQMRLIPPECGPGTMELDYSCHGSRYFMEWVVYERPEQFRHGRA